jgi:kynurenine formamidase
MLGSGKGNSPTEVGRMAREVPSEETVTGWLESLRNWGKWGAEDELGTLNYITAEKRRAAAGLVREGEAVSCASRIIYDIEADTLQPVRQFMLSSGDAANPDGMGASSDLFQIAPHGYTITHMDALAHIFWRGEMYNGRKASQVTTRAGASAMSIEAAGQGVVTRGVLLDIPKLMDKPWLEPGEAVFPEDLEAAERAAGVRVESGDALLVRTGNLKRRATVGPGPISQGYPGLQAACLPWLHERQVALLACDCANDVSPSGYKKFGLPIHAVGLVSMGLYVIDHTYHEDLAAACERYNRWEFQFVVAPLKLKNGTGCPVNPIAIF